MLQSEAEARLGREIDNSSNEDVGFLTCNMQTLQFDWVRESLFDGKAFDSPSERMLYLYGKLTEWQAFFRQYTKTATGVSQDERLQVYLINRHIKAVIASLCRILNINFLKTTKE